MGSDVYREWYMPWVLLKEEVHRPMETAYNGVCKGSKAMATCDVTGYQEPGRTQAIPLPTQLLATSDVGGTI